MAKVDEVVAELAAWLVDSITQGVDGTWTAPWHDLAGHVDLMTPANALTGRGYRGINTFLLASTALERGYPSGVWATYKQWLELGAQVSKGEKSTACVKWVTRQEVDAAGNEVETTMVPTVFHLFSAAQVTGYEPEPLPERTWEPVEQAEKFFARVGADVRRQPGNRAFYSPANDRIVMPAPEQFADMKRYYGVLAHEHAHWTGHRSRNARDFSARFGDDAYAIEELVAELSSATVLARLGLSAVPQADHAQYIAHWTRVLGAHPAVLMTVCAKSSDAVEFLELAAQPTLDATVVAAPSIAPACNEARPATELAREL